ncbi:MAG: hypothetical protein ABL900_02280 [Burkholderiaceae bacterium]
MNAPRERYKSKTLATWIALLGGGLGLHRFYLHGLRDPVGWLLPWPTLLGAYGVHRARTFGLDDPLSWLLIPLLGLVLAATMLNAIVIGLTRDDAWNARFNAGARAHRSGWFTVIGVVLALALGAAALMATLAFSAQRYFEYQADSAAAAPR